MAGMNQTQCWSPEARDQVEASLGGGPEDQGAGRAQPEGPCSPDRVPGPGWGLGQPAPRNRNRGRDGSQRWKFPKWASGGNTRVRGRPASQLQGGGVRGVPLRPHHACRLSRPPCPSLVWDTPAAHQGVYSPAPVFKANR